MKQIFEDVWKKKAEVDTGRESSMSIFKDCDIRGVYGEDLREEEAAAIGTAVARILQGRDIVVGGDFRTHTPSLKQAFIRALLDGGAEVWDLGQVSTPQVYFPNGICTPMPAHRSPLHTIRRNTTDSS